MNPYLILGLWGVGTFLFIALFVLTLEWLELKIAGHIQHRVGPFHTGWHGILQPVADMIKFLAKENLTPRRVDRFAYLLAPFAAMIPPYLAFLVLPFSPTLVALKWDLALLYIMAVSPLTILGLLMAGWGSNNKYSFLGGLRAVTQLISYEIPRLIAVISVIILAGSLSFEEIVKAQHIPYLFLLPLGFLTFFISSLMEMNRIPFDLAEDESVLVTGVITEYPGIRFGLFMMGEYAHLILSSFLASYLFLSGWRGPWLPDILWLFIKVFALIFVMIWIRWTLPRFRPDQMMDFAWKILFPLSILNLFWAVVLGVML